jgi:hypothetical protein
MVNRHCFFPRVGLNPIEQLRGTREEALLSHGLDLGGARHGGVSRRFVAPSFINPKQN